MPTGAGKTVVFSQICASAIERDKVVLILSDRTEIFTQTIKSIAKHEIPICKIDPETKYFHKDAKLFVGMVETFKRRMDQFASVPFDLIIVDEAHKAAFNRVFDKFPDVRVLGCTATPVGKTLHKYYSKLIQSIDVPELIEQGYLSPCRAYEMQDSFDDLKTDTTGEFTDQSLFSHFNKSKLYEGVIEQYLLKVKGKKTLIFNCNIQHSLNTTAAFNAAGVKSYCITSQTSKEERDWILKEYDRGAFHVLNNANILVAGYDNPSIEVIMINRAMGVINPFLQACGRGSRIYPGKDYFTVIDFGGNFTRHGLWDERRTWSIAPPKKSSHKIGAAPVKSCPACSTMLPPTQKECPYCGYLFQPSEKELAEGRLVELTNKIRGGIPGRYVSDLTIPELIECERTGQLKATYVWRILRSRGAMDIGEYARIKKYKDAWVIRQLEAIDHEGTVQFMDKKINEIQMLP